jgi:hypothetical protein
MAKARATTSAEKPQTTRAVYDLIDSLPPGKRAKLFEWLARHPDNPKGEFWWIKAAVVDFRKKWLEDFMEEQDRMGREIDRVREELLITEEELHNRVPKRKMTKANEETLDEHLQLLCKHGTQRGSKTKALQELVTLPGEQGKNYVKKYLESVRHDPDGVGDMESVRQHVKRLGFTNRKRR